MMSRVLEKVGSSVATDVAIALTQEMVRIDSTNGKEDELARHLEARLRSLRIGKAWCEKTYADRLNPLWGIDSGRVGQQSQCNNGNL